MQEEHSQKPNRLINEKSPYLQQHAYNPVDWYPWGKEALDKAAAEDKPIFLSIGYASCHWCHVMEQECFNDQQVADLLNQAFVCIKVDREERPDLDAQYMMVCQAMGRNCGWPLNILLTPKLNAFFAASYIPKYSKAGLTGMLDLVPQIKQIWKGQRQQLEMVGADIRARIETMETRTPEKPVGSETLQDAYDRLTLDFDPENGGFGTAPKFPRAHAILFLLRYFKKTGEKNALKMAEKTLRQMRLGGIFDQVGFGFHRYSTDEKWLVPHFEKMLYDQALLALAYIEAFQVTGAPKFKLTAQETIDYVLRDMTSPEGGFYSGQDADTEGEEGKYYLWKLDEVLQLLSPADADLAAHLYGLTEAGNFADSHGKNILHIDEPLEELAAYKGLTLDELIIRMGAINNALFEERKKRATPAIDNKVLTDWNGLMIAALAKVGNTLEDQRYIKAAKKAADFILNKMLENQVLYHRYVKGERAVEGFLDDYAFLVFGLIELYEATLEEIYLQAANDLSKLMVAKFWDEKNGGFYQTQKNETNLPQMKDVYDSAMPSGNSVALHDLLRLSRLTSEASFGQKADQMTITFAQEVKANPEGFTFFLSAMTFLIGPSYNIIIVGGLEKTDTKEMLDAIKKHYAPNTVVALKHPDKAGIAYQQLEGKATAYVCRNQTCLPPTNSAKTMLRQLDLNQERA